MSLQPGPHDPTDDNALTPHAPGPAGPAPAVPEEPVTGGDGTPAPSWEAPPPAPTWDANPPAWQAPPQSASPADVAGAFPPPGSSGYPAAPPPSPAFGAPPPGSSYGPPPGTGYTAAPPPPGYPAGPADGPWGAPPPPGYPPAGYPPAGYQGLGYPAPRQTESKAVVGLVLAITSWVFCPVVLAVVALVVASQSNAAIAASGGHLEGRGMNTATKWISWINIVFFGLMLIAGVAFFAWVATQDPSTWSELNTDTNF